MDYELINTKYGRKRPLERYVGLTLLWGTFGFHRVRNLPQSENRKKKSKIKSENDRMRVNDICFFSLYDQIYMLESSLGCFIATIRPICELMMRLQRGQNKSKNKGENKRESDRMGANNFCFLH